MRKPLDMFHDEFTNAAKLQTRAIMQGDHKTANKQYARIKTIFKKAQTSLDSAQVFYSRLMKHEDASVRLWACAHSLALGINVIKAESTLMDLSKDKSLGLLRFDAEMTLKEWRRQGHLKF